MQIIELNELQYKNYSNIHSKKNYKQSVEFANLKEKEGYKKLYIALIDENECVVAATLILEKKLSGKYKYGYCPNGFLIDFYNISLVNNFTTEIKAYLKERNYIYLQLDPNIEFQILSNNFIQIENNSKIINDLKKIGYEFINDTSRYSIVLNATDINKTYNNFKRSLKRNIKTSSEQGVSVYLTNNNDIEPLLNFINNQNYYKNMIETFNTNNNKLEIYYAKINPEIYINNYRYLLQKESARNEILNEKLKDITVKKSNNIIHKKMVSDKLITKYSEEIIKATELYQKYPEGVIVSGCLIVNNGKEIFFVKEGYNPDLPDYRTIPILKWEIIKKYINQGITKFNISKFKELDTNKYTTDFGFNGNVIESSNEFNLVINEVLFKLNNSINSIKQKK